MINKKYRYIELVKSADEFAILLLSKLQDESKNNAGLNVLLAGGTSILKVYKILGNLDEFKNLVNIRFYCGDERTNSIGSARNNYDNITSSLFQNGIPNQCFFYRIPCEKGYGSECIDYENHLPKAFDLMIFSMGEDGHIASIFPGDLPVCNSEKLLAKTTIETPDGIRISITPKLIKTGKSIYTYIEGRVKIDAFNKYMESDMPPEILPIKYLKKGIFILSE